MECDSTISFETNNIEKLVSLEKVFDAFKGVTIGSWKNVDERINGAEAILVGKGIQIKAQDIYDHLDYLDTGVTGVNLKDFKMEISIFPMMFPEDFCDFIFPKLFELGAKNISCYSDSEYGTQTLSYVNESIRKTENMYEG